MRSTALLVLVACLVSVAVPASERAGEKSDYAKAIVGCWLGPRKFEVYHANGTWGVKRHEDSPEESRGRRWKVEGDKLILTFPGDGGSETITCKIISCGKKEMVLEVAGAKQEYTRYSTDCQNEA